MPVMEASGAGVRLVVPDGVVVDIFTWTCSTNDKLGAHARWRVRDDDDGSERRGYSVYATHSIGSAWPRTSGGNGQISDITSTAIGN